MGKFIIDQTGNEDTDSAGGNYWYDDHGSGDGDGDHAYHAEIARYGDSVAGDGDGDGVGHNYSGDVAPSER